LGWIKKKRKLPGGNIFKIDQMKTTSRGGSSAGTSVALKRTPVGLVFNALEL
jgi:hypothetical protein